MLITNFQILSEAAQIEDSRNRAMLDAEQSRSFYTASLQASHAALHEAMGMLSSLDDHLDNLGHSDFRLAVDDVTRKIADARGHRDDAETAEREAHESINKVRRLDGQPSIDYETGEVHCDACSEVIHYSSERASWFAIEGTAPYECRLGHGMHVPA